MCVEDLALKNCPILEVPWRSQGPLALLRCAREVVVDFGAENFNVGDPANLPVAHGAPCRCGFPLGAGQLL